MAITIQWDQVDGAEVALALQADGYAVRTGIVFGLTTSTTDATKALTDAIIGADADYSHPDPRLSTYKLSYVIARGDPQNPQNARVWARYQPPNFSGTPVEKLAIEVGGATEFDNTERDPKTGDPLTVLLPSSFDTDTPSVESITPDDIDSGNACVTSIPFPRITKYVNLVGLFAEAPANLEDLENKVNDANWPTSADTSIVTTGVVSTPIGLTSRPKGHWRGMPADVRWSQRDGLYAVSLSLASKGANAGEDWSAYKFAVNPSDGKTLAPKSALMRNLISQEYAWGIRNNKGGVLKVGPYDTANFGTILGPIINHSPLRSSAAIGILNGV